MLPIDGLSRAWTREGLIWDWMRGDCDGGVAGVFELLFFCYKFFFNFMNENLNRVVQWI